MTPRSSRLALQFHIIFVSVNAIAPGPSLPDP
jgi:hypothetical protein